MNDPPERPDACETENPSGAAARAEAAMAAAGLWLARLDSGTADREAFERWRAADPAHAIAFARVASAWTALEAPAVVVAPPPVRRAGLSRRSAALALGGVLVSAAAAGMSTRVLARERVATGTGERRTLRLAADVRADLNTDSQLSWRARDGKTMAWLERGETALAVAEGGTPVVLHAAGSEWRLGPGRYNLRLLDGRLELITLDGAARGAGVQAQAGQRVIVAAGEASLGPAPEAALETAAAWPQGEIVFVDTPLSDAVAEYNRYLERKIVIADPAIAGLRIGGRFTSSDPTDFLSALQAVLPVRARRAPDAHLLTAAE